MSTWQATVRAPSDCLVLMSGEEEAVPVEDKDRCKPLFFNVKVKFYCSPAAHYELQVCELKSLNSLR